MKKMSEPGASLLLLLLLISDIAFNLLHIFQHTFFQDSPLIYERILAYLDLYHLIKLFWIIVLIVNILVVSRYLAYSAWILIFTVILLDDALLLHQLMGDQLAARFYQSLPGNLELPPRLVELAVLAIAGLLLLLILAWAYFRSHEVFRKISMDLLLFMIALVFFGLLVDVAAALQTGPARIMGLVIVEDAGEMVVLSLILWYVFLLAMRKGKPDRFLLDFIYRPGK